MSFVQATRALFKLVFGIFYRVEIKGYENIPDQSDGYVLCANHACWFDPLLIGTYYPKTLHFMAKKELFEKPILGSLVKKLNAFPVDRKGSDLKAIKTALKILKNDNILGIFPEGTRSHSQEQKPKAGVAIIAIKAKRNVLPLAIVAEKNYRIFTKIKIIIGEIINLEEYHFEKKIDKDTYQEISDGIMKNIYSMKESEKNNI